MKCFKERIPFDLFHPNKSEQKTQQFIKLRKRLERNKIFPLKDQQHYETKRIPFLNSKRLKENYFLLSIYVYKIPLASKPFCECNWFPSEHAEREMEKYLKFKRALKQLSSFLPSLFCLCKFTQTSKRDKRRSKLNISDRVNERH